MTVRLEWVDNSGAEDGYRVYRSEEPLSVDALPAPIATLPADTEVYDDSTVTPGVTYYYRVVAYTNGPIGVSSEVSIQASGQQASPWTPGEISNMNLWLDASDAGTITLSGTNVSQWSDKSGAGNHATPYNQGPTVGNSAGKDVVRFNGSNQLLQSNRQNNIRSTHVIIVGDSPSTDDSRGRFMQMRESANNTRFYVNVQGFSVGATAVLSNPPIPDGFNIISLAASGNDKTARINGVPDAPVQDSNSHTSPKTYIGGGYDASFRYGEVDISEVMGFPAQVAYDDIFRVEGYLAHKWGLTDLLDSLHPYKNSAPVLVDSFDPMSLFSSGKQGAWYDPSDLSTLFQDVAGTIPVTADGDPVGLMLDKSGNGEDMKQSTLSSRPVYRTDGVRSWLEFNGSSHHMFASDSAWINTASELFISVAINIVNPGGSEYGAVLSKSTGSETNYKGFNFNEASSLGLRIHGFGSDQSINNPVLRDQPMVASAMWVSGKNLSVYQNGVVQKQMIPTSNNPDSSGQVLTLGKLSYGSFFKKMNFYGCLITRDNVVLNRLGMESYLASKANVTLA